LCVCGGKLGLGRRGVWEGGLRGTAVDHESYALLVMLLPYRLMPACL
jgi:hypothetical protein